MEDAGADEIGPLWIRRQVFEHSVAVPLLTSSAASQIDFTKLAAELVAASVTTNPASSPAVTYDAWVAAAGLHVRLDSSEDAGIIIEALETNAPDSFVRVNDPKLLAPGRQVNYRQLLIPVPELLAFIKLHAAATISSRFRESADAIWPDPEVTPVPPGSPGSPIAAPASYSLNSPLARQPPSLLGTPASPPLVSACPPSLSPASPRLQQHVAPNTTMPTTPKISPSPIASAAAAGNQSPNPSPTTVAGTPVAPTPQSPAPPSSPGLDTLTRKKTPPPHLGVMIKSQSAIIASVQHAFQRETRLVVNNLKALLLTIAAAYEVVPDPDQSDIASSESGIVMGSGAIAAESGTLARDNNQPKSRKAYSVGSGSEALMEDDNTKYLTRNLPISRQMFEHLSFLLTTTCDPDGAYRPISWVIPQWRDWSSNVQVPLGELTDIITNSLVKVPLQKEIEGSTDVAEIRDLDRRTILRQSIPTTNTSGTGYPHAKEIRISNCTESHFYLLSALGRISMIACRDCTLFVGACVSISLINCVNMRVHAITRVCRMTNCFDTHAYLCTNRYPQIVGENRGLLFAPYNASFATEEVERYLASVGVNPMENVWDKFYRPAHRSLSPADKKDPDLTPAVASVLPPEQFLPFAVPVKIQKSGGNLENPSDGIDQPTGFDEDSERNANSRALFKVPLPLPPPYTEQLKKKCAEITNMRREMRSLEKKLASVTSSAQQMDISVDDQEAGSKDVPMSDGSSSSPGKSGDEEGQTPHVSIKKGVVQSLVQERFREWLTMSGRIRQINDLVRLEQDA